jgi:stringent starvation protein B
LRYASEVGTGEHTLPAKKDVARGLLLRGAIYLHLDPRVDGTVVPRWLGKQPQLVLQVGLDMAIPDLRVDGEGVSGTLSFNRSPFRCTLPWAAIFGISDDQGRWMVWPDSLPGELRRAAEEAEAAVTESTEGPALSAADLAPLEAGGDDVPARRRRLPPYLRVVK